MYWNCGNHFAKLNRFRLTLTWDVLKYFSSPKKSYVISWLTLTWDVLKYSYISQRPYTAIRLTLTWDVLKCRYDNI